MGEQTTPASGQAAGDAWPAFQTAFTRLVEETVRRSGHASPGGSHAGASVDVRKMVTEAVGAVLLETPLLEKVIEKALKSNPAAAAAAAKGGGDTSEAIRQEAGKVVREYLSRHLGVLFQTEIRGVIQKEMKSLLASDDVKEMIDDKFRMINQYLKTDVIPKVVHQELAKSPTA